MTRDVLELSIAQRELPLAQFQVAYEAGLIAFGGTGPYRWQLQGSVLPAGLAFREDGLIFGTPAEAGTFTLAVQVTDSTNRTASETLSLLVVPPPRVTCSSRTLGTLVVGEPFEGELLAAGGRGAYEWTTVGTLRSGASGGQPVDEEAPPPGLTLALSGEVFGSATEVGQYLWSVQVTAAESGDSDVCTLQVDVVPRGGITVTTVGLPNAVPERDYRVQLQAIGGYGELVWSLAQGTTLPEGLALEPSGAIVGTPTTAALAGQPSRTFAFLVEVRDERNVAGLGALSLTLAPESEGTMTVVERKEDGCQTAGGGFSVAALALVLLGVRRRR
jgi:uncharacterized protein (TIGR03382 family)